MTWRKFLGLYGEKADMESTMPHIYSGAQQPFVDKTRRAEDKYAHLEKLAAEEQVKLLARKDGIWAEAQDEHKRDVAGYKMKCERWGNFLNLSIARMGNEGAKDWNGKSIEAHWSGALNLDLLGTSVLIEGHAPDCEGVVTYSHYQIYSDGNKPAIVPQTHGIPTGRSMIYIAPLPTAGAGQSGGGSFYQIGSNQEPRYEIKLMTPNFPRAAEDDKIVMADIRTTLFVPAGLGRGVYERLLRATKATR